MQYLAKSTNQGYNYTSYALDTALWGAIFLAGIGRSDIANSSVNNTAAYQITLGAIIGYRSYLNDRSSILTVWFEGTYSVAQAYASLGQIS